MFDFFSLILVLFIIFAELAIGTAIFYIGLEIIVGIPMRIIFSLTGLVSGEVNNYKKKKAERYDTQDDLSQVKVRKNKNNYVQVESLIKNQNWFFVSLQDSLNEKITFSIKLKFCWFEYLPEKLKIKSDKIIS